MRSLILCLALGCGTTDPDPDPIEACVHGFGESFETGTLLVEQSGRAFVAYADGCNDVEVISGFQGGWHIEPAIAAPADSSADDLEGTFSFEVVDAAGDVLTQEATFELEPRFWQPTGDGLVYWGDTIVFDRYPELGDVTLRATIKPSGAATFAETIVEHEIELVDDEAEGG